MRNLYRERLKAIRLGSAACVVLGFVSLLGDYPLVTRVAGGVILLGGVAAYLFWVVYLEAHPAVGRRQRRQLLALYVLGMIAFLSAIGVAAWSVAAGHGGSWHWLVVGFAIVECGEHFGVRRLDGKACWRARGSPRHWLGGAAGVALRRLSVR